MENQLLVEQPINNQSQLFSPNVVKNNSILGDTQDLDTLVQKHTEAYLDTTIQPMMVHVIDRQLDFVKQEITELTTTRIEDQFKRLYQTLENNRHDMRDLLQEFSIARQQITQQHKQLVHKLCDSSKRLALDESIKQTDSEIENSTMLASAPEVEHDQVSNMSLSATNDDRLAEPVLDKAVDSAGSMTTTSTDAGFSESRQVKRNKKLLDRLYIGAFSMSLIIFGSGMTYLALNAM